MTGGVMEVTEKVSCAKCRWRRAFLGYRCAHPEFSERDHISGDVYRPLCERQNPYGDCELFARAGKLRLFIREWQLEPLLWFLGVVAVVSIAVGCIHLSR